MLSRREWMASISGVMTSYRVSRRNYNMAAFIGGVGFVKHEEVWHHGLGRAL